MKDYICYGLFDPRTAELRYIGKSSNGLIRPRVHSTIGGRKGNTHRAAWLRQLYKDSERLPFVLVLQKCQCDREVLTCEIQLIEFFRKQGFDLTNLSAGGDGAVGVKKSEETRKLLSLAHKGRRPSDACIAAAVKAKLGKKFSEEIRAKQRLAWKTRPKMSLESVARSAEKRRGMKRSLETRQQMSISAKARKQRERVQKEAGQTSSLVQSTLF